MIRQQRCCRRKEVAIIELNETTSITVRNEILSVLEQKGAKYKAGWQVLTVVAYPDVVKKVTLNYFKYIKNTYFKPNYTLVKCELVNLPSIMSKMYTIYDFTVHQRSDVDVLDPPCFPRYKAIARFIKPDPKVSPISIKPHFVAKIVAKATKSAKSKKPPKSAKGLKPLTSVAKTPIAVKNPPSNGRGIPIKSVKA
jgi:hypothetical protein